MREWLTAHYATERECWIVMYRKQQPEWDALPYIEIVEEALCFGRIDSTNKKLPDGRLVQRISPRRMGSHWTDLNIQRCHELEKRGLMTETGQRAIPNK